jgi:hypothetical protein
LMVTAFVATGAALAADAFDDGMDAMSDGIVLDGDAFAGDAFDDGAPEAAATGCAGLEHAARAAMPARSSADAQSERRRRGRAAAGATSCATSRAAFGVRLGVSLFEVT